MLHNYSSNHVSFCAYVTGCRPNLVMLRSFQNAKKSWNNRSAVSSARKKLTQAGADTMLLENLKLLCFNVYVGFLFGTLLAKANFKSTATNTTRQSEFQESSNKYNARHNNFKIVKYSLKFTLLFYQKAEAASVQASNQSRLHLQITLKCTLSELKLMISYVMFHPQCQSRDRTSIDSLDSRTADSS